MTPQNAAVRSNRFSRNQSDQLKDEIYRQMFRLEENRPGAEMGLALALVRAWLASESEPERGERQDWLKKISSICLQMIETALEAGVATPGEKRHSC